MPAIMARRPRPGYGCADDQHRGCPQGARFGVLHPCDGSGLLAGVIGSDDHRLMARHTGILLWPTSPGAVPTIAALASTRWGQMGVPWGQTVLTAWAETINNPLLLGGTGRTGAAPPGSAAGRRGDSPRQSLRGVAALGLGWPPGVPFNIGVGENAERGGLWEIKQRLRLAEKMCRDRLAMGMTLIRGAIKSPVTDRVDVTTQTFPHGAGTAGPPVGHPLRTRFPIRPILFPRAPQSGSWVAIRRDPSGAVPVCVARMNRTPTPRWVRGPQEGKERQ